MTFRVSGKNIELGEALRERIHQRVLGSVEKYFHGNFSGHVTIGPDGFGIKSECHIHLDSGELIEVDALASEAYDSADKAAAKLEDRLRRYKERLRDRHDRSHRAEKF